MGSLQQGTSTNGSSLSVAQDNPISIFTCIPGLLQINSSNQDIRTIVYEVNMNQWLDTSLNWPLKLNLSPNQMLGFAVTPISQNHCLSGQWAPLCPRPLRAFIKIQLMSCLLVLLSVSIIFFGVACIAPGEGYSPAIPVQSTLLKRVHREVQHQRAVTERSYGRLRDIELQH